MQMGDDKMKDTLKDVCATFLSIVLFFCIVVLSSILVFQNLITKENIKQMVKNTDFTTDVKNRAETKQMEDIFSDIYIVADKYHIPEQFIDNVFNDEITKEFLGTVAANVIDETLTGHDEKVLTAEDLNELLENNMEHFQEVSNIQLTEQQEENFLNLVNEHSTTIIEILPTTTELQTYMNPDMIEGLKILNSSAILYSFIGVIILSSILIIQLKWKEKTWLLYFATPLLFAGITLMMLAYAAPTILSIVLQSSNDIFYLFVDQLAITLKEHFITLSVCFVITSILIYIIHFIQKKIFQRKK